MDRIEKVIYVDTLQSQSAVQNMFAPHGEIRGLYRWKSDRDKIHYFVEFAKAESVNRARSSKLNVPDTHVHALAYIPQLIDRFCALAGAAGDPVPDTKRSRSSSPRRSSTGRTRRTSASRSRDVSPHTPTTFFHAFGDPGFTLRAPSSSKRRSPSRGRPLSVKSETLPGTSTPSPISISLSGSSLTASFPSEPTPRTSRHILTLTVCDQPITVNLDRSEDDPKGIISLLELSTCERDKWFIVAAHYRRGGNPVAAIKVLASMMKADMHTNGNSVFRRLGVTEEDMKPAFLMVSACHGDQAKRTKDSSGLNTPESTRHYQLSLEWLRKVYGTSVSLQNQGPAGASDLAGPISLVKNDPSSKVSSSQNRDERLALPPRPSFVPSPRFSLPAPPQNLSANRIRTLEHQVDVLRERNARSERSAAESEGLKRKYEQELSHEKSKRRRIQAELDEFSAELKAASRMEKYASDLAKREAELRRKAEMREKELIKRLEALEKEKKRASDGGKAVLFEDLANMFQKAAQAQGDGGGGSLKLSLESDGDASSFGGSALVLPSDHI